jgi:hypothetical protein
MNCTDAQETTMDDQILNDTIQDLVTEEQRLWDREAQGTAGAVDQRRLAELQVVLDQCCEPTRRDDGRELPAITLRGGGRTDPRRRRLRASHRRPAVREDAC